MTEQNWGGSKEIWRNIRPPLVPVQQDIDLVFDACGADLLQRPTARILVLGVTPALISAPWPTGFELCAVDFDPMMINALWPDEKPARASVICADWKSMPFPDDYFDLVIGDCSFCALPSLADYAGVLAEVDRVKKADARVICRFFMQSEPRLTLADLPDLCTAGALAHFSGPEKNLMIAIAASGEDAVTHYRTVIGHVEKIWGDFENYVTVLGQSPEEVARVKSVFSLSHQLNYPTLRQIADQFAAFGLKPQVRVPDYPSGPFCPTIAFG